MAQSDRPDIPPLRPGRRQLFHPSTNTIARVSIFGGIFIVAFLWWVGATLANSSYTSQADVALAQPVQFSHEHHVGGLGIGCQYCHNAVEDSSSAGMPPTHTCMTCHSQIWSDSPMLEPVRESYRTGEPIRWNRVYDLPDFVYFNHSIHVQKGVGCTTCHGQVNEMPLMRKAQPLSMGWCLSCHREPEREIRPRDEVFNMNWTPPPDQIEQGRRLLEEYHVDTTKLTNCSICHR
jgi:hypothetical protein